MHIHPSIVAQLGARRVVGWLKCFLQKAIGDTMNIQFMAIKVGIHKTTYQSHEIGTFKKLPHMKEFVANSGKMKKVKDRSQPVSLFRKNYRFDKNYNFYTFK